MGIFGDKTITRITGTIDRIGVEQTFCDDLHYVFTLEGRDGVYRAYANENGGRVLALARKGDVFAFDVQARSPYRVHGHIDASLA